MPTFLWQLLKNERIKINFIGMPLFRFKSSVKWWFRQVEGYLFILRPTTDARHMKTYIQGDSKNSVIYQRQ